ncbi:MAG: tetratricopeptide repeat protein [Myxococcota bacterium]
MRSAVLLTSLTSLTLFALASPANAEWVLPPHAASAVQRAAAIQPQADKAGLTRSAALEKTTIKIEAKDASGAVVMVVTLVHPSVAPTGAFTAAGAALLESPGPLDAGALASLKTSLKRAKRDIPWVETEDNDGTDLAAEANTAAALDRVRRALAAGKSPDAVREGLAALPSPLSPSLAVRAAVVWHTLGDTDQVTAVLAAVGKGTSPVHVAAQVIQGKSPSPPKTLGNKRGEEACAFREVVHTLASLARHEEAMTFGAAIFERAPGCPEAWEMMIHRHLQAGDETSALSLADRAREQFKGESASDGLLAIQGSVYLAADRHADAAAVLERVAARDTVDEGSVRMLLSATLRDPEAQPEHLKRLEGRLKEGALPDASKLVLAALYHNANRFKDSAALLKTLGGTITTQARAEIYRALNAFNLGDHEGALALIEPLTKRSNPDPFAFYCRAEFIRKTDREQAKRDLQRYLQMAKQQGTSNPAQVARVNTLIDHLTTCVEENMPRCPGKWENPRIRTDTAPLSAKELELRRKNGDVVDSKGVRWDKPVHEINMVIDVATTPEDYGGNLFLLGFRELDIGNQPVDHLDIAHYHQLAMWLQRFPYRAKVELVEGIKYRAVYSHNDFPLIGDAVSTFFEIGDTPPATVSLVVNRYGHERNDGSTGATPVLNWKGSAATQAKATTVSVFIEPNPAKRSGKVFIAGFKALDKATGMPSRDVLPADYHTIKGVDKGLPLRVQLPLVNGLHYIAVYGFDMFPGDTDRMSELVSFKGEGTVSFTIAETTMQAGRPASSGESVSTTTRPADPTIGGAAGTAGPAENAMSRTWFALLLGLLAVIGVVALARRGNRSPPTA